jgi:hypothetical protein
MAGMDAGSSSGAIIRGSDPSGSQTPQVAESDSASWQKVLHINIRRTSPSISQVFDSMLGNQPYFFVMFKSLLILPFRPQITELTGTKSNGFHTLLSVQSQFLLSFEFGVHGVFHTTNHIHQFYSNQIQIWDALRA